MGLSINMSWGGKADPAEVEPPTIKSPIVKTPTVVTQPSAVTPKQEPQGKPCIHCGRADKRYDFSFITGAIQDASGKFLETYRGPIHHKCINPLKEGLRAKHGL